MWIVCLGRLFTQNDKSYFHVLYFYVLSTVDEISALRFKLTVKALIRLCWGAGWSGLSLSAYALKAHLYILCLVSTFTYFVSCFYIHILKQQIIVTLTRLRKYTVWAFYFSHTKFTRQSDCPHIGTGLSFSSSHTIFMPKQATQIYEQVWVLLFS